MRHRKLAGAATAVVLLLGGCGIPDETGVTDAGPGPSTGISSGDDDTVARVTRDETTDRTQFIDNYLQAAAGDYDTALDRVKDFMPADEAAEFTAPPTPRVIRLTEKPLVTPGQDRVVISYEMIGTLGKNGLLDPATEPTEGKYEITLGEVPGNGLYVLKAPAFLLLSDDALDSFYEERTIYFWNTEHTGLVPDVRYMLRSVPVEQEPTTVLGWLIDGPAAWLRDVAEPLPEGTATVGKVFQTDDDKLQINLTAQALPTENTDQALERLRKQLQWSLRPLLPESLDLKIGHEETRHYSGSDYLSSNVAYRLAPDPERFVVFGGQIRRLSESPNAFDPVPAVGPDENKNVRLAALSSSTTHTFAALVTGAAQKETLKVGAALPGENATLRAVTGLPAEGLQHPVWATIPDATTEGGVGLIIAGGKLYSFRSEGGVAQQVVAAGGAGTISAISVAPDGHRVALVSGGRLYRAVLTPSGQGLALSTPQEIQPPLSGVTAVDFSGEGWLTVAGTREDNDRVAIKHVSIDGALEEPRLPDIGKDTVNYLTAYPANPVTTRTGRPVSDSISYTTADAAWDALSTSVKITAADLAGEAGEQPAGTVPTAPFFLN
ncbi:LpqB family beta-propeller domain-containing protein [Actinoplanes sp. NBRC 101535]|uniref:LpqB family beta-propeller domain-containing protein n=1 Tax=Actinoplanes sp. NBRC 101535 TaxID=3032196 RepID=UPI0024A01D4C|nr:LpqB family beta-propeller domain-containing protein [Actinoplanes sp. NBRC 101535]GLY01177.1 hypothetical protein Acsp01_15560 [Actinoplanes sp. NBRC 101535]